MKKITIKKAGITVLGLTLLVIAFFLLVGYTNYCYDQGYRDAVRDISQLNAE